jgi:coenzyme F420-reducing hydrogenase delta subunit
VKAISQEPGRDVEILEQISAALNTPSPNGDPSIIVFGCEWSGQTVAELAGARRIDYPAGIRLIQINCSARFDPFHALWAFVNGADGVFVGACRRGECHYLNGNAGAYSRFQSLGKSLAARGFDTRRLRFEWVTPDDPNTFAGQLREFSNLLTALVLTSQVVLADG